MPQLQESKMTTYSVRYEPHLSDKARSTDASRLSIAKNVVCLTDSLTNLSLIVNRTMKH